MVGLPQKSLIKSYHVDELTGAVTLTMPELDPLGSTSVAQAVADLKGKHKNVGIEMTSDAQSAWLKIEGGALRREHL